MADGRHGERQKQGIMGMQVTCRSVIKLRNLRGAFLHSHEIPYGSGSGQQSVTGAFGLSTGRPVPEAVPDVFMVQA